EAASRSRRSPKLPVLALLTRTKYVPVVGRIVCLALNLLSDALPDAEPAASAVTPSVPRRTASALPLGLMVREAPCSWLRSSTTRLTMSPAAPPKAKYWSPAVLNEPLTSAPYAMGAAAAAVVWPAGGATGRYGKGR